MSKTTIKELALSLSEKHDLSKADAERFVAAIFEVINDGLEDDKLVKVKGLGAFKIIGVAARKSVDVNTGEPIVIEGRNKISFTPDASMRDDVNKPFSQFETVAINDGVDFSGIDMEYENATVIATEYETEARTEAIEDVVNAVKEETEKEEEVVHETDAVDSSIKSIEENSAQQKEDEEKEAVDEEVAVEKGSMNEVATKQDATEQDKDATERDSTERDVTEQNATKNNATELQATEQHATTRNFAVNEAPKEQEVERITVDDEETHQKHALKALMITAVVIVIGCLCGGYYLFSQIQRRDSHIEMLEKQMRLVAQHQKKSQGTTKPNDQARKAQQAQDSATSKADGEKEATKQVPQAESKQEPAQADSKPETQKAEDKQTALQDQYNKDVRIRTGAYVIVGIKKTVTVRSGQTMDGISRSNLGPGMECYLEAINGGRRELKAGESINIPELKLKKRLR